MDANPSETTGADGQDGRTRRRRPLVSPDAVRRWAAGVGLNVGDGPLDELAVELYLLRRDPRPRRRSSEVVDSDRAARASAEPRPQQAPDAFGPEPCPSCGEPGYLDYVDLERKTQTQRCRPCGKRWTSAIPGSRADARSGRGR